jgi:hypothetical protein
MYDQRESKTATSGRSRVRHSPPAPRLGPASGQVAEAPVADACMDVMAEHAQTIRELSGRAQVIGMTALAAQLGSLASFGLGLGGRTSETAAEIIVYLQSDAAVSAAVGELGSPSELTRAMLITWRRDLEPRVGTPVVNHQGNLCPNVCRAAYGALQRILDALPVAA